MKNKECLLLLIFSFFYIKALTAQPTDLSSTGLPDYSKSKIAVGDINNDGNMDIVISGIDGSGNYQTKIFGNNGNGTFTDLGVTIASLVDGDIALADFNGDNYLDIAICGRDQSNYKFTRLYRNNKNNTFTQVSANFQGLYYGSIAWGDYDNDGDLDLLVCGQDGNNIRKTLIYENTGNETFVEHTPNIPGVSRGQAIWGDINKDGYIDISISGLDNNNNNITEIYTNNGDKTFTSYNANLQKLAFSKQQFIDFDNDGDLDLCICGRNSTGTDQFKLYKNTNGNFTEVAAGFNILWGISFSWCDYNTDGNLDLICMGLNGTSPTTYFYQNNGNGTFTLVDLGITGLAEGDVAWFDLNNDHKQDIAISGSSSGGNKSKIYQNNLASANSVPAAPTSLSAIVTGYQANLSWNAPADAQTPAAGLSYRICLGTTTGNYNIQSPMSNITSGNGYLKGQGLIKGTSFILKNLPQGAYFWTVQAIDASGESSMLSSESSFSICDPVNLGADRGICTNSKLELSAGTATDQVNWYSEKSGLIASNNRNLNYTITQNDKIWVAVSKNIGCTVRDTILVTALALPGFSLPASDKACFGTTLKYNAGGPNETVKWYTLDGSLLKTGNQVDYKVMSNTTIKCEITGGNNCIDSAKIAITSLALPQATLGNDFGVCKGQPAQLQINGMQKVNWYSLPWFQIASNKAQLEITITKDTTIIAEFIDANACTNYDTVYITSSVIKWINAGNDTIICYNTSTILGGNPTASGGTAPYTYSWLNGNNQLVSSLANPSVSPTQNTDYTLQVLDNNGCSGNDKITVRVNPKTEIEVTKEIKVCYGNNCQLGGNPTAKNSLFPYTYQWSPVTGLNNPGIANPVATLFDTTRYRLVVQTGRCAPDTAFVQVNVTGLPKISISNNTSIGFGGTTTLEASGGIAYQWSPSNGLSNPNASQTGASPESTTTYTVTVADENNCQSQAAVTVNVQNNLFIPNLFTPNGDGSNDAFKIYGTGINELHMVIYNRNGNIVFETNDVNLMLETGWDGKTNGANQPQGSYLYVISGRYVDGTLINYNNNKGTVNLMR